MKRRDALKNTALVLGYAVSASTVAAVMQGCTTESTTSEVGAVEGPWTPKFLNKEDYELVSELAETILPETATPGAKSVGAPQYIDAMLSDYYDAIEQRQFLDGLTEIAEEVKAKYSKDYLALSQDERTAYLTAVDQQVMQELKSGTGNYRPFFATLKELTWVGFFTSETIGEEYLNYDPIPGGYHGCVPLEETGGKAWSL